MKITLTTRFDGHDWIHEEGDGYLRAFFCGEQVERLFDLDPRKTHYVTISDKRTKGATSLKYKFICVDEASNLGWWESWREIKHVPVYDGKDSSIMMVKNPSDGSCCDVYRLLSNCVRKVTKKPEGTVYITVEVD